MFKKTYVAEIYRDNVIIGSISSKVWFWQTAHLAYKKMINETDYVSIVNFRRVK